jgi:3-dehydroquinate synthase
MQTIKVNLVRQEYEIRISGGLLGQVGEILSGRGFTNKVIVITNPGVNKLYGEVVRRSLQKAGCEPAFLEVPDGEEYKSLEWAGKLYDRLAELKAERKTPVLALGGGVIGDLAGFVAATYMRGVPFFQLPTTLLAQVDSSIGGKVAVNHGQLKNNVGTFYHPGLVFSDISVLKTLPEVQINNGLAEVIKYGVIADKELFAYIENNLSQVKAVEEKITEKIIARCAAIKAEIVEKDELDLGLRNILNFGHTTGHAVETVSNFQVGHGQAVSIGMVAAGMISQKLGVLESDELNRVKSLLVKTGLPVNISEINIGRILQAMQHDKKNAGGKVKFILPRTIGGVFIVDNVNIDLVGEVLKEMYEESQDMRNDR